MKFENAISVNLLSINKAIMFKLPLVLNILPQSTKTWPLCCWILCWCSIGNDLKAWPQTLQGWPSSLPCVSWSCVYPAPYKTWTWAQRTCRAGCPLVPLSSITMNSPAKFAVQTNLCQLYVKVPGTESCHVSYVMCHVSCVMCHVSCVMCHVSCVMCHVSCVMCHVSCVMFHVSCVMCHVSCVMCNVWCVMCDVWCVICDLWCVMCDEWCVMCDVWCVMCDVWYVMCDVWFWCVICHVDKHIHGYCINFTSVNFDVNTLFWQRGIHPNPNFYFMFKCAKILKSIQHTVVKPNWMGPYIILGSM